MTALIIVTALVAFSPSVWAQETEAVFNYDREHFTDAKPWTGKPFQDDQRNFSSPSSETAPVVRTCREPSNSPWRNSIFFNLSL
jgi:hypothetical protein